MKKTIAVLGLVAAMVLSGCSAQPKIGSGGKALATSGSDTVLLSDYLYALNMTKISTEYELEQYGYSEEDIDSYWDMELSEGRTLGDDLKEYVLEQMKYSAAFVKLGKAQGISYDTDKMKEYDASLSAAVTALASKDKTGERAFYDTYWVTKEEALDAERNISISDQYMAAIEEGITVPQDEINAYYEEHKDELKEVTIAHILIKYAESGDATENEEKKALAEEILARAQNGEDFGAMAAEYSEDDGSKDNNGEYTINRETSFVQEFMDWSFSNGEGDMGIIETDYGYHIMKFIRESSFEDLSETVENAVKESKFNEALTKILEENAIEWTLDEELYNSISLKTGAQ